MVQTAAASALKKKRKKRRQQHLPPAQRPTTAHSAAVFCGDQNKTSEQCQFHGVWSNFNRRAAENKALDRNNWTLLESSALTTPQKHLLKVQVSRCHFLLLVAPLITLDMNCWAQCYSGLSKPVRLCQEKQLTKANTLEAVWKDTQQFPQIS